MDAFALRIGALEKKKTEDDTLENIKKELRSTEDSLNRAQIRFDYLVDDDLIESQIYEIRALKARYSYYLKKAKELKNA